MSQAQQTASKIEALVTGVSDKFIEGVEKTQNAVLGKINAYVRKLELTSTGAIKANTANIKLLRTIRFELNEIIVNPAYRKKLDTYLKGFDDLKVISDQYFAVLSGSFVPTKFLYKEILNSAIDITKNSLLEAGISENVIKPISDILTQNITSGALVTDLEETLRIYIIGDKNRLGRLQRYTTQITRDALNQYNANYTQAITNDLGLRWFYYSAGIKQNTRSYCQARAGKYFTIEQVRNVPDSWSGRIPGTNSSNILTYRGGYSCMHTYIPVLEGSVPEMFKDAD